MTMEIKKVNFTPFISVAYSTAEAYSERQYQTFKKELFSKLLTIFTKRSILDVRQGIHL